MRVAACQLPDVRDDVERALSLIETYALAAQERGAGLVCFPECFLQGYSVEQRHVGRTAVVLCSPAFERIVARLERIKPTLVIGLIERKEACFYNAAVVLERGNLVGCYRKNHLLTAEKAVFTPGDSSPVFDPGGRRFGISICYDTNHPEAARSLARQRAKLLVCPANNMLPRKVAEKWRLLHNEIRAQRARESALWVLSSDVTGERDGCVSYGPTSLINPLGQVIDQVPLMKAGLIVADIAVPKTDGHRRTERASVPHTHGDHDCSNDQP